MALLTTADLLNAFVAHIGASDRVDIAVAWLSPSRALGALLRRAAQNQLQVRLAVGLSGNATSPVALRSLQQSGAGIRVANPSTGIFHPKFYLFNSGVRKVCWIGSSNFTFSGFVQNAELIYEFADEDDAASEWFERLWGSLPIDSGPAIDYYEEHWTRPSPSYNQTVEQGDLPDVDLWELLSGIDSWTTYVSAIHTCDAYWRHESQDYGNSFSVIGEEWSWVDTISHGNEIARRTDWTSLSLVEKRILFGRDVLNGTGGWGLLGGMGGAAAAYGRFLGDASVRAAIRQALQPAIDADNEQQFIQAAIHAVQTISGFRGFGSAIATRLLSLARPDRAISVNQGSAPNLSKLTGLTGAAQTLGNERNYPLLLQWLYRQTWYNAIEPADALGQTIWSMRAALVDSFVYEPV